MKPRLMSRILQPHGGGFSVPHPMTGFELYGTHFEMLYNRYVAYNKANSLPVGLDDEEMLMGLVCKKYSDECTVSKQSLGLPSVQPGLFEVVRGSAAMINHKLDGSQLVSQEEANRRAEICYKCPLRAQMTLPCARCTSALENVVGWITGSRGTPYDEKLSACGICKCFLSAAVWLPLENQCVAVTDDMKEKFVFAAQNFNCWKQC